MGFPSPSKNDEMQLNNQLSSTRVARTSVLEGFGRRSLNIIDKHQLQAAGNPADTTGLIINVAMRRKK